MNLEMLRDEYDLARRYTQSLYADLPEADVYWRPAPKSSGIGWHLGGLGHITVDTCGNLQFHIFLLA
jgi:hypothetical protein